ncbi:MAG: hypothetical protein V1770_03280 [bacterium]
MKYIELTKKAKNPIFSLHDLKLMDLNVYPYQISEWADKEYIIKLKNGLYIFADRVKDIRTEFMAFNIYQPSYISLEWALSIYSLIPEVVYNCTSITTKTTRTYENKFGAFIYRHINPKMFFGYTKIENQGLPYLLAEAEKALIDYAYLNMHKIKNRDDVDELRLNEFELKNLNKNKIKKYLEVINNKHLEATMELILK